MSLSSNERDGSISRFFRKPMRNVVMGVNFVIFSAPIQRHRTARIYRIMSWNCAFCVFSTILLHLLLTHINTSHNNDNNFLAYCGIDGCDRSFRKANTFARHVREKHRSYLYNNRQEVELQTLENKTGKFTLIYNYIMFVVLSTRSVFKLIMLTCVSRVSSSKASASTRLLLGRALGLGKLKQCL